MPFLARTTTPSMAPSSAEVTLPVMAAEFWAQPATGTPPKAIVAAAIRANVLKRISFSQDDCQKILAAERPGSRSALIEIIDATWVHRNGRGWARGAHRRGMLGGLPSPPL